MTSTPKFPDFKPLALEDRQRVHDLLWRYQPDTSELTFTNLFIWRDHYRVQWSLYQDWLLLLCSDDDGEAYALPPVGPASRLEVTRLLLQWIREAKGVAMPRIERADMRLITEIAETPEFSVEMTRDHFDYVYEREALATLAGRKYSAKRNHINNFMRTYGDYTYETLTAETASECLDVAHTWCMKRRCEDDLDLLEERDAVFDALQNFVALEVEGGLIRLDGHVQAFTLGELLNDATLVVHIEKADPDIQGLYPLINQQFIQHYSQEVQAVNREQDLGEPGLRRAKESYYPHHLVEKARIRLY